MARAKKTTATDAERFAGAAFKAPTSPEEPMTAPPPPGGPGSPMEIVFSFDTTGSMYSLLGEVRKNVSELIQRLQADIPNIRIGVIAHGDYCDEHSSYVVKMVDFTRDTDALVGFVNHVGQTGGGDGDECYELALKTARAKFSWTAGSQRSLVVIGDADPHETTYPFYKDHTPIDWKKECDSLAKMGVHIYGVGCKLSTSTRKFYEEIARRTDGTFLEMNEFANIFDMMCAICYKEHGAEYFSAYEQEVRDREKRMLNKDLDHMLVTLRKSASNASTMSLKDTEPPARPADRTPPAAKKAKVMTPAKSPKVRKPECPKAVRGKPTAVKKPNKIAAKNPSKVSKLRRPRESAPAGAYRPYHKLDWSNWVPLISSTQSSFCDQKHPNHGYYRNTMPFIGEEELGFYEVAVTPPGSNKKYIMYIRLICHRTRSLLDTELFHYLPSRNFITDLVLKHDVDVYVRRAVHSETSDGDGRLQSKMQVEMMKLKASFDYAWNKNGYGRTRMRKVTKKGVVISSHKY